jgi:hypothetical protein
MICSAKILRDRFGPLDGANGPGEEWDLALGPPRRSIRKASEWKLGVVLPVVESLGAEADCMLPDIHRARKAVSRCS